VYANSVINAVVIFYAQWCTQ